MDILINNAANNPKMDGSNPDATRNTRLENFPLELWNLTLLLV